MIEITIILLFFGLIAFAANRFLWGSASTRISPSKLRFFRFLFVSAWFTPSAFLSSHAIVPLPAILALVAGVFLPSPSYSIWFSIGLFFVVFSIGMVSCYLYYFVKQRRIINAT
jgi:hypothetical protein